MIVQTILMLSTMISGVVFHSNHWPRFWLPAGVLMICGSAVFGISGVWVLKSNRTIFPKPRERSELVQSGVYRYVRHPLYTSVMLFSVGWALVWGSVIAVGLATLMMTFFYFKARAEEVWLREKFPQYRDYEQKVRRFFPWIF